MIPTPSNKAVHAILMASALLAAGCAVTPAKAPPISESSASPTTLPAGTAVRAADLLPLRAESRLFDAVQGSRAGRTLSATIEADGPNRWLYTLENTRTVFLEQTSDGAIVVPREQDVDEAVDITYEPAFLLMPATLTPGEPVDFKCHMTVRNIKGGGIRDEGECTSRITLTGRRKVTTPAGEFDAMVVETTREIRLKLASVSVSTLTAYAPGQGTVAESVTQNTKALGIIGGSAQEVLKLKK